MSSDHYGITRVMIDGGREVCVRLSGDVDGDACDDLRRELSDAATDNAAPLLVVDLHDTLFLDSEAVGAVVAGCLRARESGKRAEIINARGVVRTILVVTGVLDLFGATPDSATGFGRNVRALPQRYGPGGAVRFPGRLPMSDM
ncbi:STAS domain-containing protein [Actinoplanes sp. NPDC051494]|uniref:STAS domain-containing protein n=1 Tax=Actinoplanes sp. NPDC051494 TaxID=3363907 RepID=UPI0037B28191